MFFLKEKLFHSDIWSFPTYAAEVLPDACLDINATLYTITLEHSYVQEGLDSMSNLKSPP